MAFAIVEDPEAIRALNVRGGRSYNHGQKVSELHGREPSIRENDGDKAIDSDGELHVDVSSLLDDLNGADMEIYESARLAQWVPHQSDVTLKISNLSGNFNKSETITGGSSGATADIESIEGEAAGFLQVSNISGSFTKGEEITGGGSSATADLGSELVRTTPGEAKVDTVEIPKQRVVIAQVRELSTGAPTAGSPTVTYTGTGSGVKA